MSLRIAAGILIAAAAGCSDDGTPSAAAPPAPAPALSEQPQVRRPAGEVPPDSRVAHDPGGATAAPFAGFDYAFPGPPGSAWHYHVRVPDAGTASAAAAGGTSVVVRVSVRAFRVASASDAAAAAKRAIAGLVESFQLLDPATAGGCGTEAGHTGAAGTRRGPPVRVLRAPVTRETLAAAGRAAAALPGLEPMLEADLGGASAGDAWLDLHFVEK